MKITSNISTVLQRMVGITTEIEDEFLKTMRQHAEVTMTAAKEECPVDFGILRASGIVRVEKGEGRIVKVALSFGGAAAPYAIYVHENLEAKHNVGKAKFLEDPMRRALPGLQRALKAAMVRGFAARFKGRR